MADEKSESLYLSKIQVSGYKSIDDLTIDFNKGLNIIIGKNGVGKSIFFELLNEALVSYDAPQDIIYKVIDYQLKSVKSDRYFRVEFLRDYSKLRGENTKIESKPPGISNVYLDNNSIIEQDLDSTSDSFLPLLKRTAVSNDNVNWKGLEKFNASFSVPLLLKYDTPEDLPCIDSPGTIIIEDFDFFDIWDCPPTLGFLHNILQRAEKIWNDSYPTKPTLDLIKESLVIEETIISAIRKFTPISDVRFNPNINLYDDLKNKVVDNVRLEFYLNNRWHPWSQLSDGTRRLFYLVAEITDKKDGVILIEEPELGVHPHQFHLLMNFIREESASKQIILSTHSPQTLDHLELDELDKIIIATYDIDSGTKMRHLNEEEKEKAKEYVQAVGYLSDYWLHSDLEV